MKKKIIELQERNNAKDFYKDSEELTFLFLSDNPLGFYVLNSSISKEYDIESAISNFDIVFKKVKYKKINYYVISWELNLNKDNIIEFFYLVGKDLLKKYIIKKNELVYLIISEADIIPVED